MKKDLTRNIFFFQEEELAEQKNAEEAKIARKKESEQEKMISKQERWVPYKIYEIIGFRKVNVEGSRMAFAILCSPENNPSPE